jgi:hypothetical protein
MKKFIKVCNGKIVDSDMITQDAANRLNNLLETNHDDARWIEATNKNGGFK